MIAPVLCLLAAGPVASGTVALTLEEAVSRALSRAPSVREAGAAQDLAALASLRAQLDRVSLKVDAQVQEIWARTNLGGDSQAAFSGTLGLSNFSARVDVPVFSGFRVESNAARADHLEAAAGHDRASARRAVALAAARAYLSTAKLDRLAEVTRAAIARLEEAEGVARARVDAGLAPPVDYGRALSRRRLQEVRLQDLLGQRRESGARLAVLLGLDAPPALDGGAIPPASLGPVDEALDEAFARRPELAAVRARRRAQDEAVTMARSGYYPQVGLYGLFQFGNNPFVAGAGNRAVLASANPFEGMVGDLQLGATLSLNIFDTLNTYTSVQRAQLEASRLDASLERARMDVEGEVRGAHASASRAASTLEALEAVMEATQDNLRITRQRYEDGQALVFELLEAELELADVERQRASAAQDLVIAHAELAAAVGRPFGAGE